MHCASSVIAHSIIYLFSGILHKTHMLDIFANNLHIGCDAIPNDVPCVLCTAVCALVPDSFDLQSKIPKINFTFIQIVLCSCAFCTLSQMQIHRFTSSCPVSWLRFGRTRLRHAPEMLSAISSTSIFILIYTKPINSVCVSVSVRAACPQSVNFIIFL